jgi:hypothetical protein
MTTTSVSWSDRARLELALLGVDAALIGVVLTEVGQHCADSGEAPEEAFGTPADFAAEIVAERVPPADRAKRDRGGTTVFEAWSSVIAQFALTTVLVGVLAWIKEGLIIPLTVAGLVGVPIAYAARLSMLYASTIARRIGKPRTVIPAWIATGVLVLLAAYALVELSHETVGSMPAPLFLVAGGLLAWWGYRRESASDLTKATESAEEWLDELRGLLEGRHDVSRARADDLVKEAAQHLATSERTPQEEFGPVDEYAMTVAEHQPAAPLWWQREITRYWVFFGVAVASLSPAVLGDHRPTWYWVTVAFVIVLSSALLVRALRGK